MMRFHYPHRLPESLREARLLLKSQAAPPENPFEQPVPPLDLAKDTLADLIKDGAPLDRIIFAVHILGTEPNVFALALERSKSLPEQQRAIIAQNLEKLKKRTDETESAKRESIERIQREFAAAAEPGSAKPAQTPRAIPSGEEQIVEPKTREAPQEKQGFWSRSWEQAADYWNKTSPTVKAVGVGTAAALLAYGTYRLFRWLWGGTKKAAEKTVEKTKEGMSWMAKTAIGGTLLAVAGVLGFLGFRGIRSYLSDLAADTKNKVKEGVREGVEEGKAIIEAGKEKSRESAREATEKGQRVAAGIQQEAGKTLTGAAALVGVDLSTQKGTAEAQRRVANDAAEAVITRLTNETGPTVYANMQSNNWTIGDILQQYNPEQEKVRNPEDPTIQALIPASVTSPELRGRYVAAAEKLICLLGKHATTLQQVHERRRAENPSLSEWNDVPVASLLEEIRGSLEVFHDVSELVQQLQKGGRVELGKVFERVRHSDLLTLPGSRAAITIRGLELPSEVAHVSATDLYLAAAQGGILQKTAAQFLPANNDDRGVQLVKLERARDVAKKELAAVDVGADPHRLELKQSELRIAEARIALLFVVEFITKTGSDLMPLFHGVLPDREWSLADEDNARAINGYLRNRQVGQLLDFYLCRRMMADEGNPVLQASGLLAQQIEILNLIDALDAGWKIPFTETTLGVVKSRRDEAILGMGESILDGEDSLTYIATALGVAPTVVYQACTVLKDPAIAVAEKVTRYSLGPLRETLGIVGAMQRRYPGVMLPVEGAAAATACIVATRWPRRLDKWWHTRLDPSVAMSKLKRADPRFWQLYQAYLKPLLFPNASASAMREAGTFLTNLYESGRVWDAENEWYTLLHKWMNAGAKEELMEQMLAKPVETRLKATRARITALVSKGALSAEEAAELTHCKLIEPQINACLNHIRVNATTADLAGARIALSAYARPVREWMKLGPPPSIAAQRQMGKLLDGDAWTDILKKFGGKVQVRDIDAVLQLAEEGGHIKLDAKTLSLIRQSAKAKEIIAGAANTADFAEVTRALKAAKMAAGLRAVGSAGAFVGDTFGVLMAYCDWQEHGQQIVATTNPALKDLHRTMQNVSLVEGGVSAAGVVIQGFVFTKALLAGEGLLAAAGTTALSVLVLPVVAAGLTAAFVARPIANRLYAVAKDWTEEEQDMIKYHQGELLRRLETKNPGEQGYWQRRAAGSFFGSSAIGGVSHWLAQPITGRAAYQEWQERNFQKVETSNALERSRISRAIFLRMINLPQEPGETEEHYNERFKDTVKYASLYIDQMSDHTHARQFTWAYGQAERYAELRLLSERLLAQHAHQTLYIRRINPATGISSVIEFDLAQFDSLIQEAAASRSDSQLAFRGKTGVSIQDVIVAYDRQRMGENILCLQANQQMKGMAHESVRTQCRQLLLAEIRYDLAAVEAKLLAADLSEWTWTNGEDKTRDCLRLVIQSHLLTILRQEADRLTAKPGLITHEAFEHSLAALRAYLQRDAEKFVQEYQSQKSIVWNRAKKHRIEFSRKHQTTQELLSLPWLAEHLDDPAVLLPRAEQMNTQRHAPASANRQPSPLTGPRRSTEAPEAQAA